MIKSITACAAAVTAAVALSGCESTETSAGATVTQTVIEPADTVTREPAPTKPASAVAASTTGAAESPSSTAATKFVMPNEVGKTLQQAQDHVQEVSGNPGFFTRSEDATGASRQQVVDSNWRVCSQNVKAGAPVSQETDIVFAAVNIVFAAVKLTEACP